ncbi:hypothetical protein VPHD478_0038 [Vibrio phage D478]
MSIGSWIGSAISGIVSPITGMIQKRDDNKTKVKLSQVERIKNAEDSAAELEKVFAENAGNGSWKDEYVTLIISLPIPVLFFSVLYSAFTGEPAAAEAAKAGVEALKDLLPDYNDLLMMVCLAAIGIRLVKK